METEHLYTSFKKLVFDHHEDSEENLIAIFELAESLNDFEIIKKLSDNYQLVKAISFLKRNSSNVDIGELIAKGHDTEFLREKISEGVYINKKNSNNETPLMIAITLNRIDVIKLLLQNEANTDGKFENGKSLVEYVFEVGYKDALQLLINNGAKNILEDYAESFFYKVNKSITSQFIAKQFVYEELDAARQGNDAAKKFVENSGVEKNNYFQAMQRSLPEVDGANGPQQILLFRCLTPLMNDKNGELIADIRILVVDKIMKEYTLGKYKNKSTRIVLENSIVINLYNNYALIENEKFELIDEGKYYNQKRQIYFQKLNNAIMFSKASYAAEQDKEYFKIIESNNILQREITHNPKRIVKILNLFTKDNPIKYMAHSFEWSRFDKSYDNFMKQVKEEFSKIDEDLKQLSPNLYTKISKFLFDATLNNSNSWGMNKMTFGWSSHELREWSQIQESEINGRKAIYFPLPQQYQQEVNHKTLTTFDDVCNIFKNEIEIRDDDRLSSIFEELEEEILGFDFEVEYINLENITFYTDVEYFRNGVVKIFEQFKCDERKNYNNITVQAIKDIEDKYVDIIIKQIGSTAKKESSVLLKEVNNGDFQDIKNCFLSLCDWSIEANFKDGNFRIDYLSIDTENTKSKSLDFEPEGFSHILRFYK